MNANNISVYILRRPRIPRKSQKTVMSKCPGFMNREVICKTNTPKAKVEDDLGIPFSVSRFRTLGRAK